MHVCASARERLFDDVVRLMFVFLCVCSVSCVSACGVHHRHAHVSDLDQPVVCLQNLTHERAARLGNVYVLLCGVPENLPHTLCVIVRASSARTERYALLCLRNDARGLSRCFRHIICHHTYIYDSFACINTTTTPAAAAFVVALITVSGRPYFLFVCCTHTHKHMQCLTRCAALRCAHGGVMTICHITYYI